MAYVKRVPPIKLVLTKSEYNILVGVLTKNYEEIDNEEIKELAKNTREKFLQFGLPHSEEKNKIEIDIRLYLNEAADIISQLLLNISKRTNEINYYQVLLKVRENMENNKK